MTPIMANCRDRFTAEDFRVIAAALTRDPRRTSSLTELLTDPAARDAALESDRLFRTLLESPELLLTISPQLYFYVLTRRLLHSFDRDIADYIASLLSAFLDVRRFRDLPHAPDHHADSVADMLTALTTVSSVLQSALRAHIANHALFMTGIFPERVRYRAAVRGAPDISFYEEVGSMNYRLASDHELAQRDALVDVYRTIANQFSEIRRDLNRLSCEYLCLNPFWSAVR